MAETILKMSLYGSAAALVVMLLRRLPKIPASIRFFLWAFVFLRLILPPGLFTIQAPISMQAMVSEQVLTVTPFRRSPPAAAPGPRDLPLYESAPDIAREISGPEALPVADAQISLPDIWEMVWLLGVAVCLLWMVIAYGRVARSPKYETAVRGVYASDYAKSPFVIGIFRPIIILPFSIRPDAAEEILLHERLHIKRGDHITKLAASVIVALHWFNPLVWLAYRLSICDMEMAVDEAVLKRAEGDIRKKYASELVCAAEKWLPPFPCFGESSLKKRIKSILSFRRPSKTAVMLSGMLVLACGVFLLAGEAPVKAQTAPPDSIILPSPTPSVAVVPAQAVEQPQPTWTPEEIAEFLAAEEQAKQHARESFFEMAEGASKNQSAHLARLYAAMGSPPAVTAESLARLAATSEIIEGLGRRIFLYVLEADGARLETRVDLDTGAIGEFITASEYRDMPMVDSPGYVQPPVYYSSLHMTGFDPHKPGIHPITLKPYITVDEAVGRLLQSLYGATGCQIDPCYVYDAGDSGRNYGILLSAADGGQKGEYYATATINMYTGAINSLQLEYDKAPFSEEDVVLPSQLLSADWQEVAHYYYEKSYFGYQDGIVRVEPGRSGRGRLASGGSINCTLITESGSFYNVCMDRESRVLKSINGPYPQEVYRGEP